jgi:hypothetical protein
VIGGIEKWKALQVVHVAMADQQVEPGRALLFELEAQLANTGAGVEDNDALAAAHLDAGGIAPAAQRGRTGGCDRAPGSPELNGKRRKCPSRRLSNSEIAELNARSVSQQPNVTARAREARVLGQDGRIAYRIEIGVDDSRSVQNYCDFSSFRDNFFLIPLAGGLLEPLLGGNHVIDRAVILGRPQLAMVTRGAIVEDLNFHSLVGCVSFIGRANADAVVRSFEEAKFEAQKEVRELFGSEEVTAAIGGTHEEAVFHHVTAAFLSDDPPAIERFPVEQRHEARVGRGNSQRQRGRGKHTSQVNHYRKFTTGHNNGFALA